MIYLLCLQAQVKKMRYPTGHKFPGGEFKTAAKSKTD